MSPEVNTKTMSANVCSNSYLFFKCGFFSTNRRKVPSACVIVLLLFLQETVCQDKQKESTSKSVDLSHGATLIPLYPPIYSCCDNDIPKNGNTTTIPTPRLGSSEISNCKLPKTKIDTPNMISIVEITSRNFTMRMQTEKMRCSNKTKMKIAILLGGDESQKEVRLLDSGYLKMDQEYYAPDEFCVHKITEMEVEVFVCPTNCEKRLCIRKCCGLEQLMSLRVNKTSKVGCEDPSVPGNDFRVPLYLDYSTRVTKADENKMPLPHYTTTPHSSFKYNCPKNITNLTPYSKMLSEKIYNHTGRETQKFEFRLRKDGHVLYRHVNGECKSHSENFCIDGIQTYGTGFDEPFLSSQDEMILVTCSLEDDTPGGDTVSKFYGPLMLSVSIFPFLTTLVYVLLWKKQTIHGWTIVSTSTSLLFMYIFIGISHVLRIQYGPSVHYTKICVFIAVASHFFFLSTFTWLTIMCFDLWFTFRTLTPRNRQSKGFKRFINYALFGWGIPTVVIGVSLFIHYMEDNCNDYLIVPAYGRESCYLNIRAMGVYLYYPSIALLTINLVFFSVTCWKLYEYRQSCQMANKTDMKECFSRFTKLFFVMGVTWMFEIISWAIEGFGFIWYWAIFDTINILRAAAVFIIYVCKRDILVSLEESYPQLKKFSKHREEQSMMDITNSTTIQPSTSTAELKFSCTTDCTDL